MKKQGARWAKWNAKLEKYDLLIDMANIRCISRRAYATGKLSPRIIKKWQCRARRKMIKGHCQDGKCQWLPSYHVDYKGEKSFWWKCRRCRCVTKWLWEEELSLPMLNAYKEHTRRRPEE